MQRIIALVGNRIRGYADECEVAVVFDFSVFDQALEGLVGIQDNVSCSIEDHYYDARVESGIDKFNYYMAHPEHFASYGAFVASLTGGDLVNIICRLGEFNYSPEELEAANEGNLLMLLNHIVAKQTAQQVLARLN
jgi:hypothetical protein